MRTHRIPMSALFSFCAATLLIVPSLAVPGRPAPRRPKILGRKVYRSPDRTLVATVVTLKQLHRYGEDPSRVEIRRAGGHLLASRDHSFFPNQGYTVDKAAWTADSRIFVYLVSESGGHQPWRSPMFFYSRKRHRFYSLDKAIGCIIDGDLELRPPCTVVTEAADIGKVRQKVRKGLRIRVVNDNDAQGLVEIDLRQLEPRLSRSAETSDQADKADAQREP